MPKCRKMLAPECVARDGIWAHGDFVKRKDRPFTGLCKKCNKDVVKAWMTANPAKKSVVRRRVNKRAYDKHQPARTAQKREYAKKNPAKRKSWAKRRMEARGIAWELKPGQWPALLRKYGNKCIRPGCGATKDITQDHVVSLYDGGRHHIDNLQPLCRSCNSSKGRKSVDYRT